MKPKPLYLFAKWQLKKDSMQAVLQLIPELMDKTRQEAGNLQYNIYQSMADANQLVLFEAYKDNESLETHRNSEHFQSIVINQIVPLLENRELVLASELTL